MSTSRGDCAILTINDSFNGARVKSETFNSDILTSGGVSDVFTDSENDRDGFGLIAIGIIEITHEGLGGLNSGISGFPHHGDVLVFGNGVFTNCTSSRRDIPV